MRRIFITCLLLICGANCGGSSSGEDPGVEDFRIPDLTGFRFIYEDRGRFAGLSYDVMLDQVVGFFDGFGVEEPIVFLGPRTDAGPEGDDRSFAVVLAGVGANGNQILDEEELVVVTGSGLFSDDGTELSFGVVSTDPEIPFQEIQFSGSIFDRRPLTP